MKYLKYLAVPFKPSSASLYGCDCYGLVKLFHQEEFGVTLPDLNYELKWFKYSPNKILKEYSRFGFRKIKQAEYGDILVLLDEGLPKHLGVVVEDGYFIHTTVKGTICNSYTQGFWSDKIVMILRFKGRQK